MKNKEYITKIKKEYHKASKYSDELYQNFTAKLKKIGSSYEFVGRKLI